MFLFICTCCFSVPAQSGPDNWSGSSSCQKGEITCSLVSYSHPPFWNVLSPAPCEFLSCTMWSFPSPLSCTVTGAYLWVEGEVSSDARCACSQELHENHKVRTLIPFPNSHTPAWDCRWRKQKAGGKWRSLTMDQAKCFNKASLNCTNEVSST